MDDATDKPTDPTPAASVAADEPAEAGGPPGRVEAIARLGLIEFRLSSAENLAGVKAAVAELVTLFRDMLTA